MKKFASLSAFAAVSLAMCAFLLAAAVCLAPACARADGEGLRLLFLPGSAPLREHVRTGEPHWYFTLRIQETGGMGVTIDTIKRYELSAAGSVLYDEYDSGDLTEWFGSAYVGPWGMLDLTSGRPADGVPGEPWEITATDNEDRVVTAMADVALSMAFFREPSPDAAHDTVNLRAGADFEVPVANGVWWVPASSLGPSLLGTEDVMRRLTLSPQEKRDFIGTLYEALQLFQAGAFRDAEDKAYAEEHGITWEHHKPGFHAVRTNEGCCATNSNWLHYLLDGNYEEVGYLAYSQEDGSGHVMNYIRDDGWWYFVDLTHYRTDYPHGLSPETGNTEDYLAGDFVAGNLHKAASPADYVRYCLGAFAQPPGLFVLYEGEDWLPLALKEYADSVEVLYPQYAAVTILYDDPHDRLELRFAAPPDAAPGWDALPDAAW